MPEREETLTMNHRERDRLSIITRVLKGDLTCQLAAENLNVTERQFYRILRRYRDEGDRGIIHRQRGKKRSNRNYSEQVRMEVLRLFREQYSDYHPTLLSEILLSERQIDLSRQTLSRWLRRRISLATPTAQGILQPRSSNREKHIG